MKGSTQAGECVSERVEDQRGCWLMQAIAVFGQKTLHCLALEARGAFGLGAPAIPHAVMGFRQSRDVTLAPGRIRSAGGFCGTAAGGYRRRCVASGHQLHAIGPGEADRGQE